MAISEEHTLKMEFLWESATEIASRKPNYGERIVADEVLRERIGDGDFYKDLTRAIENDMDVRNALFVLSSPKLERGR